MAADGSFRNTALGLAQHGNAEAELPLHTKQALNNNLVLVLVKVHPCDDLLDHDLDMTLGNILKYSISLQVLLNSYGWPEAQVLLRAVTSELCQVGSRDLHPVHIHLPVVLANLPCEGFHGGELARTTRALSLGHTEREVGHREAAGRLVELEETLA